MQDVYEGRKTKKFYIFELFTERGSVHIRLSIGCSISCLWINIVFHFGDKPCVSTIYSWKFCTMFLSSLMSFWLKVKPLFQNGKLLGQTVMYMLLAALVLFPGKRYLGHLLMNIGKRSWKKRRPQRRQVLVLPAQVSIGQDSG